MFELTLECISMFLTVTLVVWCLVKSPLLRNMTLTLLVFCSTVGYACVRYSDNLALAFLIGSVAYAITWIANELSPVFLVLVDLYKRYEFSRALPPDRVFGPENLEPEYRIEIDYRYRRDSQLQLEELDWIEKPTLLQELYDIFKQIDYGVLGNVWVVLVHVSLVLMLLWVLTFCYGWLNQKRSRVRRGYQEIMEAVRLGDYVQEKMAPGSTFVSSPLPKMQCEVWISVDAGAFIYSGQGFRVGDNFFTASHVVAEADEVKLQNPRTKQSLVVPQESFISREGDIAVAKLGNQLSTISLGTAKRFSGTSIGRSDAAFVSISALGQMSFGLLTPHTAFGFVTYSGSTISGFSGAPYLVNGVVCGMHIGHQGVNLGYDGGFLQMVIKAGEESTLDFLMDLIKRKGRRGLKFHQSPYDPSEYRVNFNGKYYLLDEDEVDQLNQDERDWAYHDDSGGMEEPGARMGRRARKTERDEYDAFRRGDYSKLGLDSYENAVPTEDVLSPRDLVYTDSGNEFPAPARRNASAGADGNCLTTPVVVRTDVMQKLYPTPTSQFPKDVNRLVTGLPASIPVEQDEVLPTIQNSAMLEREIMDLEKVLKERYAKRRENKFQESQKVRRKNYKNASQIPTGPGNSQSKVNQQSSLSVSLR